MKMPPAIKTIIPPEGGWKEQTYYVVEIAWKSTNPIHRRILYVGFLNGGKDRPLSGGYTSLLTACDDDTYDPERAHYLKIVSEIEDMRRG